MCYIILHNERKGEKGKDVMCRHTWNLCSAFHPSKCTHSMSSEQTHTRSSGQTFLLQRPGRSWGFSALLKGLTSAVVLKVEKSAGHSFPPPIQSLKLEPATFGLQVLTL